MLVVLLLWVCLAFFKSESEKRRSNLPIEGGFVCFGLLWYGGKGRELGFFVVGFEGGVFFSCFDKRAFA